MKRFYRYWPILFFAILPLLPLWRVVFLGEWLGPFDQIASMAPWHLATPDKPWDILQADGALQFYAWRDLLFHGNAHAYNPYQFGGAPFLANSQTAVNYLPHLIFRNGPFETETAIKLLAWFHLFVAGIGTYKLARVIGSSKTGATVAGTCFALSPFMLAWTVLASVPATCAWIPWCLYFGFSLFQVNHQRMRTIASASGLALSILLLLTAGHLQFAAYGMMAFGLVLTWKAVTSLDATRSGIVLVSCVAGLLMAYPTISAVLDYSKQSHRISTPSEEGYQAYIGSALKPFELANLALPSTLGNPQTLSSSKLSTYWPALTKPGGNFAESTISIGPLAFLILCLMPWKKLNWGLAGPLVAIGAISALLALGTPLNRLLYFYAPGWSGSGSPGRVEVLFVLVACVFAGHGLTKLSEQSDESKLIRYVNIAALFGLTVSLALATLGASSASPWFGPQQELLNEVIKAGRSTAIPIGIVGMGLASLAIHFTIKVCRIRRTVGLCLVGLCAFVSVAPGVITTSPSGLPELPFKPNGRVAVINGSWDMLATPHALLPPNTASIFRIQDIAGYDSLISRDTVDILRSIDGRDPAPAANGNILHIKPGADATALAEAGVEEIWSEKERPEYGQPFSSDHGVYRYRLDGPGWAFTPQGRAEVVHFEPDSFTLKAVGPGLLTVKTRNIGDWRYSIANSTNVEQKVGAGQWLTVPISSGETVVKFRCVAPDANLVGSVMKIAPWLLIALMIVLSLAGNYKASSDEDSPELP